MIYFILITTLGYLTYQWFIGYKKEYPELYEMSKKQDD